LTRFQWDPASLSLEFDLIPGITTYDAKISELVPSVAHRDSNNPREIYLAGLHGHFKGFKLG
jgi:hypothetical protein